jgi:hypothetical protein
MGDRSRLRSSPLPPDIRFRGIFLKSKIRGRPAAPSPSRSLLKMYTPPPFKSDRAAAIAFAQARGFGTICGWDGAKPVASSLPFCLRFADDGTPIAAFHVARGNALARLADGKSRWLLAVNGADAYDPASRQIAGLMHELRPKIFGNEAFADESEQV